MEARGTGALVAGPVHRAPVVVADADAGERCHAEKHRYRVDAGDNGVVDGHVERPSEFRLLVHGENHSMRSRRRKCRARDMHNAICVVREHEEAVLDHKGVAAALISVRHRTAGRGFRRLDRYLNPERAQHRELFAER